MEKIEAVQGSSKGSIGVHRDWVSLHLQLTTAANLATQELAKKTTARAAMLLQD